LQELKLKYEQLTKNHTEASTQLVQVKEELSTEKKKATDLGERKVQLETQVSGLEGQVSELSVKFENETQEKQKNVETYTKRANLDIKGLETLKKNLEEHVDDLHRWQKYLDMTESEVSGDIRPQILSEISKDNFDEQLEILTQKLANENKEMNTYLKQKEAEQKVKKSQEQKKKERQTKANT